MNTRQNADAAWRTQINARLDRLPGWGLNPGVYVVLGLCYLLAFYDIAVIGVSLPRIIADLHLSKSQVALPITLNLIGYIVGAYVMGNVADRIGRRRGLAIVVLILAVSSVLTALSWDGLSLAIFRFIAGFGIGSQITLAATLIGEFAPAAKRGQYLARNILWAAFGNIVPAVLAIFLLDLNGDIGWRILIALSALIVFTLPLFTDRILPESPRWLAINGQLERAEKITKQMEERNRAGGHHLAEPADVPPEAPEAGFPTAELFRPPLLIRTIAVFGFWFFFYFAVYAFLAFETTLYGELNVALPSEVMLTAIGLGGGVVGALLSPFFIDRLERKYSVMLGLSVFALGFALLALAQGPLMVAIGGFLVTAGLFFAIIPAYAYTAEVFPTRARATAMGVGDGLGHVGGAVQPYIVLPVLAAFGARAVFVLLIAAAGLAFLIMFSAVLTTGRSFSEIGR